MNIVMIVPTGVGAAIGGHAGDAGAAAKLLASCCTNLITHPNVVNASDINEMTDNMWYVDGYHLDRFLWGEVNLFKPKTGPNKILLAVNGPLSPQTENSVNAAKYTMGANVEIAVLNTDLVIKATKDPDGSASGEVSGAGELLTQLQDHDFDVLAIQSRIDVEKQIAMDYLRKGGINPWGGAEAIVSRWLSRKLQKIVAHAPLESEVLQGFNEVVHPRMAAELVSISYLHCVLRGLHDCPLPISPKSVDENVLGNQHVDALVAPYGLYGIPHQACLAAGIPIISVQENSVVATRHTRQSKEDFIHVRNYLEAAGHLMAMRAGVTTDSVRADIRL